MPDESATRGLRAPGPVVIPCGSLPLLMACLPRGLGTPTGAGVPSTPGSAADYSRASSEFVTPSDEAANRLFWRRSAGLPPRPATGCGKVCAYLAQPAGGVCDDPGLVARAASTAA